MEIIIANRSHLSIIQSIAEQTWPDTYGHLLSKEQIAYMMEMMYSEDALTEQITNHDHRFLMIKENDSDHYQGFVSYEFDYDGTNKTKLHKLYVLPECHGTGMGRILVERVCEEARKYGNESVLLNMNRQNKALNFYKHMDFEIVDEGDFDIGNGFLMQDYIFEKKL